MKFITGLNALVFIMLLMFAFKESSFVSDIHVLIMNLIIGRNYSLQ